jgi:hypothetical protein
MANINELGDQSPLKDALNAGITAISHDQEIVFTKYARTVLPLDGYVFWVKDIAAPVVSVKGSLHYDTDQQQRADETIGLNRVVFTTQDQIQEFNAIAKNEIYIGQIDDIRFAFTAQGKKYEAAGTYHYRGDAIYPAMLSQIIDDPATQLSAGDLIATNSMPIWLAMSGIVTMYPAFLVPANIRPPYASVEISETKPMQAFPHIDANSNHAQLMTEKVKIIMYGLHNQQALALQDFIFSQSVDFEKFGIQNMPAISDDKRGQSELGVMAQKKFIELEVNYYQSSAVGEARKLILSAMGYVGTPDISMLAEGGVFVLDQSRLPPGDDVMLDRGRRVLELGSGVLA